MTDHATYETAMRRARITILHANGYYHEYTADQWQAKLMADRLERIEAKLDRLLAKPTDT